jgi:RNA polymerase sigma factor (sigma-70 family)
MKPPPVCVVKSMSVRTRRGLEPTSSETPDGREQFSEFYRRECPRQVRRATLILGSPEAAHDAVHDAFVAVFRHWDELTNGGPYLERAVLNRCRDLCRRGIVARRRTPRPSVDVPEIDVPLFDALSTLPFNQRAAVVLRYYHQLTEFEIAELLHCRPGSVGPWIHRGLERLRKELS